MTLLFKYSNEESVKQQTLGLVKHRETQIAQHQFNSQTLYVNTQRTTPIQFRNNTRKQRTSSHITETSQLLDLSLFVLSLFVEIKKITLLFWARRVIHMMIRQNSGGLRVARGGSGAKVPPLAAHTGRLRESIWGPK